MTITAQNLFEWIDLLWAPLALLVMEPGKRLMTCAFALSCVLLLRLQIELFTGIGFPRGLLGIMDSSLYVRGLWTYGVFIGLFFILAYFSKGSDKNIHLAASITMMLASFCVSSAIMVL